MSFSKTERIEGAAFLGRRSTLYFIVEIFGCRIADRREYICGGVCAVVSVDNIVGNVSLVLVGHITCVGQ